MGVMRLRGSATYLFDDATGKYMGTKSELRKKRVKAKITSVVKRAAGTSKRYKKRKKVKFKWRKLF